MDYRETEEQALIRQTVRRFVEHEVKPVVMEYDRRADPRDCYPWDLLKKAARLGLTTMSIPARYGGGGVEDLISRIIAVEELGAGDNGFAGTIRHCIGLTAWMDTLCNEEQKAEFFPKIVADDTFLIAEGMTEPNSGTDNTLMAGVPGAAMQTYAERRGDEYIINGAKHFISNGGIAKLILLHARTDRKLPLNQCRSVFLVPSDTPGLTVGKIHDKLGRRLINSAQLFFDDMRIPARYLIQKEGEAANYLKRVAFQAFLIPATMVGTLRACHDEMVAHARTRIQGGKPIIRHQLVAAEISSMRSRIEAARALLYRQAWCWQNQYDYDPQLSILIRPMLNQLCGHMAYALQEIFGAPGVDKDMRVEKLTRDLLTMVHGPSTYAGLIRGAPDWQLESAAGHVAEV
jgi:alkylation response protein AidB-like acyl-CoA dehydrogenase